MNDRDPFPGADPTGDPIDRTLSQAFRSRPTPSMSQPSLIDVRHRARRRQQRRSAGLVGAVVLVGAGGVGAYALRHDGGSGRTALTPGDDASGAPATTVACYPDVAAASTAPVILSMSTISGPGTYRLQEGDIPATVAQKFDLTVDELNAANADLPGYAAFYVGLAIVIPAPVSAPTTAFPPLSGGCGPDVQWTWHCTGELGLDEFGRQVFQSCEQVEPGVATIPADVVPTTSSGDSADFSTTTVTFLVDTTSVGIPAGTTTTIEPTTVSINGNASTTTSLG